ncbi:MAG: Gfo/Idh/MocA family oxidoreductase [Thermoguttaceae bacterium]
MRLTRISASRRQFLQGGLAAAAACCAPTLVPSSVFGALAPSNRIHVGVIGMGNQSGSVVPAFLDQPDAQVLAVCDVNTGSHGYKTPKQFLGREPGRDKVNAYYAQKNDAGQYKGCDAYRDFREVIGRSDIDAAVIIVPDHWHALMTVAAAKAGKDIYCEKPLSLCIQQGQAMVKAVRKYNRVLQTGSPWRSNPLGQRVAELVRNGRIGKVQRVLAHLPVVNAVSPGPGWKPMPVPEGLDYPMWLGPAPDAPYHKDRCLYRFRFILDYSGGQTTNFGAHANTLAQWALGTDQSGPVEFEDAGSEWFLPGDLFTAPKVVAFRARYAGGAEVVFTTGKQQGISVRFEGTEGWIEVDNQEIRYSSDALKEAKIGPDDVHLAPRLELPLPKSKEHEIFHRHVRNFLDCMKSRKDPIEPVEVGHRVATICHLGNIAMKLRRKIRWDPKQEAVIGDPQAAAMLSRPMRAPWTL